MKRATLHKKRSDLAVIYDILTVTKEAVCKTRVVYGANLNFKILDQYLAFLERTGLVTVREGRIQNTEKGNQYREIFKALVNTIDQNGMTLGYYARIRSV